jgi:DNA-directed RNA polymerase subunit RPC12/RpoP
MDTFPQRADRAALDASTERSFMTTAYWKKSATQSGFGLTHLKAVAFYSQRFNQGGAVIKFRCGFCEQKIAVDDHAANAEIFCPNCNGHLIVPLRSAPEFRQTLPVPAPVTSPLVVLPPEGEPLNPDQLRSALLPHLAEKLTDRLVQELVNQRRQLLAAQENATERVAEFEQRVARLQRLFEQRQASYEQRIAELERELALQESSSFGVRQPSAILP